MVVRGCYTVQGFDPLDPDGPPRTYYFDKAELVHAYKHAPKKVYNLRTAIAALQHPERVWSGIRDVPEGWGLCFCARPSMVYVSLHDRAPLPADIFYCVFVGERDIVFEWRPEKGERLERGAVLELRQCDFRFKEELWTRTK